MLRDLCLDWSAWWHSIPPEFAFLMALPLVVAAAGFLGEWWRLKRGTRTVGGTR